MTPLSSRTRAFISHSSLSVAHDEHNILIHTTDTGGSITALPFTDYSGWVIGTLQNFSHQTTKCLMCDKMPYNNRDSATKAAKAISQRSGHGYKAYFCKECAVWHLYSIKR